MQGMCLAVVAVAAAGAVAAAAVVAVAVDNRTQFLHQLPLLAVGGTAGFAGIVHKPQWLEQSVKVEQAVVVQPAATVCPLEMSLA